VVDDVYCPGCDEHTFPCACAREKLAEFARADALIEQRMATNRRRYWRRATRRECFGAGMFGGIALVYAAMLWRVLTHGSLIAPIPSAQRAAVAVILVAAIVMALTAAGWHVRAAVRCWRKARDAS
jgi:hypothetical protein